MNKIAGLCQHSQGLVSCELQVHSPLYVRIVICLICQLDSPIHPVIIFYKLQILFIVRFQQIVKTLTTMAID